MTQNYNVFAGMNDMIGLSGLITKSTFTFFSLVYFWRFRPGQSRNFKATNAAAGFFNYYFFLKKNCAALLSTLKKQ